MISRVQELGYSSPPTAPTRWGCNWASDGEPSVGCIELRPIGRSVLHRRATGDTAPVEVTWCNTAVAAPAVGTDRSGDRAPARTFGQAPGVPVSVPRDSSGGSAGTTQARRPQAPVHRGPRRSAVDRSEAAFATSQPRCHRQSGRRRHGGGHRAALDVQDGGVRGALHSLEAHDGRPDEYIAPGGGMCAWLTRSRPRRDAGDAAGEGRGHRSRRGVDSWCGRRDSNPHGCEASGFQVVWPCNNIKANSDKLGSTPPCRRMRSATMVYSTRRVTIGAHTSPRSQPGSRPRT